VYGGHSSHVTCVRFSHDDSYVISTGGNDMAVFQWRYRKGEPPRGEDVLKAVKPGASLMQTFVRL